MGFYDNMNLQQHFMQQSQGMAQACINANHQPQYFSASTNQNVYYQPRYLNQHALFNHMIPTQQIIPPPTTMAQSPLQFTPNASIPATQPSTRDETTLRVIQYQPPAPTEAEIQQTRRQKREAERKANEQKAKCWCWTTDSPNKEQRDRLKAGQLLVKTPPTGYKIPKRGINRGAILYVGEFPNHRPVNLDPAEAYALGLSIVPQRNHVPVIQQATPQAQTVNFAGLQPMPWQAQPPLVNRPPYQMQHSAGFGQQMVLRQQAIALERQLDDLAREPSMVLFPQQSRNMHFNVALEKEIENANIDGEPMDRVDSAITMRVPDLPQESFGDGAGTIGSGGSGRVIETPAGGETFSGPSKGDLTSAAEENESAPLVEEDFDDAGSASADDPTSDAGDSLSTLAKEDTNQTNTPPASEEAEKPQKEPDTRYLDYLFEDDSPPEKEREKSASVQPDTRYLDYLFDDTAVEPTS